MSKNVEIASIVLNETLFSSEEFRRSRSKRQLKDVQDNTEVIDAANSPAFGLINSVDIKSLDFDFDDDEDEDFGTSEIEHEEFKGASTPAELPMLYKKSDVLKDLDSFLENEGYDTAVRMLVRSSLSVSMLSIIISLDRCYV